MRLDYFLVVFVIQIALTLPKFATTCATLNLENWGVYVFHHALDVYLFWSVLFLTTRLDFTLHLMSCVLVGLHWFFNNNLCVLTVYLNRKCGYNETDWLDSLKNKLGLRSLSEYFHFVWIGLLMAYDIMRLLT